MDLQDGTKLLGLNSRLDIFGLDQMCEKQVVRTVFCLDRRKRLPLLPLSRSFLQGLGSCRPPCLHELTAAIGRRVCLT